MSNISNMTFDLANVSTNISFSFNDLQSVLFPLIMFALGMVVYSVFIFKFYRFVARKDVFKLNLEQYNRTELAWLKKTLSFIFYVIEYILLFPVFSFFWFSVLSLLLSLLSKNSSVGHILFISMSVVVAIRITAHYSEDLSKDLAKMLPFSLLAVFLVDMTAFNFRESLPLFLINLPSYFSIVIYYLLFVIFLEFFLRILSFIIHLFKHNKKVEELSKIAPSKMHEDYRRPSMIDRK